MTSITQSTDAKLPRISSYARLSNNELLPEWMRKLVEAGIELDSHIRLFMHDGIQNMTDEDFYSLTQKYVEDNRTQKKFESLLAENEYDAKRLLFKHISHQPFRQDDQPDTEKDILSNIRGLLDLVLVVTRRKEDKLIYNQIRLRHLKTRDYYARLFNGDEGDYFVFDRLVDTLEPEPIIRYLKTLNVNEYDKLVSEVETLIRVKNIDGAVRCLLRGLPLCSDVPNCSNLREGDWYFDFLEACLTDGYTKFQPRKIDPNFMDDLSQYRARKDADNKIHIPYDRDTIDIDFIPEEPRSSWDYLHLRKLPVEIEYYTPSDYTLRPYQMELVSHAINGRNTIICAPTGSGKTLVATEIIKKHLHQKKMEEKTARVVMLVPTVPLAEQQAFHFVEYLGGVYWIDAFSGIEASVDDRAGNLLTCDVAVMTPQILINMLNSILRKEKVYFSDFTMMIFDECHHCNESHPYKILMEMLEDSILAGRLKTDPPQIVGLTASLGVGQTSWDLQACKNHMLKLCSNLRTDSISTVRHQLDDLRAHVRPPVDYVEKVNRPKNDKLADALGQVLRKIEESLSPELQQLAGTELLPLSKEEVAFPSHDNWSRYQSIVGQTKTCVQKIRDPAIRFRLDRQFEHLSYYFHAIGINDLLPERYVFEYLDSKIGQFFHVLKNSPNPAGLSRDDARDAEVDRIHKQLHDLYASLHRDCLEPIVRSSVSQDFTSKPILDRLHTILDDQFLANPDSRCLIFVSTRACANSLAHHLTNVEKLSMFYHKNNVGYMVSSNQTSSACGQSAREQQDVQQRFAEGKVKVMVVTSVAEEGIDIAACNLIIKYNSVGSERTMIQRRGRARQKNSKSILLALDNTVEQQELFNLRKEALMHACIQDLQEQDDSILRNQILERKNALEQERLEDKRRMEDQRQMLDRRRYNLNCKACGNLICSSVSIRLVAGTLYVCCDPTVWNRSQNVLIKKPAKDGLATHCAQWTCGRCGQEWGRVVKYSDVFLPSLNPTAFLMERLDSRELAPGGGAAGERAKSWGRIQTTYFNIDHITMKNIKDMFEALMARSDEHDKLERQEMIANIQATAKMREHREKDRTKKLQFLQLDE